MATYPTRAVAEVGRDWEIEMDADGPSMTAMMAAASRARHRWFDAQPWVFDDAFALLLIGPQWVELATTLSALLPDEIGGEGNGSMILRSRYTEDQLDPALHQQYVILGAGLDSFAWRRPDLLGPFAMEGVPADTAAAWNADRAAAGQKVVRVFEVDHPATQVWKRDRIRALALPTYEGHVLVPVDFEHDDLEDSLTQAGFDWKRPTLFSWLGVTMYLTREAIAANLRMVTRCAPGSAIVFSYIPPVDEMDAPARQLHELISGFAAASGEPFVTLLDRGDVEDLVAGCGLRVVDHPTLDQLTHRYFRDRPDGLRPGAGEGLITAAP